MKIFHIMLFIIAFALNNSCMSDCPRTDYGLFQTTFYNNDKEALMNFKVSVYPTKWTTFNNSPGLTSLQATEDYYGAKIIDTDESGHIEIQIGCFDGTTSCDGPRETFDNIFDSVVIFYECATGGLEYQEFSKTHGLFVTGSVNRVDSVFIRSDCAQ